MKCRRDGELPGGRKGNCLAVRLPHPAVTDFGCIDDILPFCAVSDNAVKKEVFFMLTQKGKGLKNVYVLVYAAMLAAISVVIGIFCKNFLNFGNGLFRITFENFPIIISGLAFGPVVGACVGAVSDVVSFMLSTQSFAISPIVTIGAASVGAVSGLVSHYLIKREGTFRLILSVVAAHFIGSVIIKSFGLFGYYGWPVLWRIPTYAVIAALEAWLLCRLYKSTAFAKIFKLGRGK